MTQKSGQCRNLDNMIYYLQNRACLILPPIINLTQGLFRCPARQLLKVSGASISSCTGESGRKLAHGTQATFGAGSTSSGTSLLNDEGNLNFLCWIIYYKTCAFWLVTRGWTSLSWYLSWSQRMVKRNWGSSISISCAESKLPVFSDLSGATSNNLGQMTTRNTGVSMRRGG